MKLRYRLFLWVAIVFSTTFIASFYMEAYLTRISLEKTSQELLQKLDSLNEKKAAAIEDYLADMLFKIQAKVDAVLEGVSKYPLVRRGFEPTIDNLEKDNWLDAASLMITNKWIDFIQSTNEETLMSEIIIDKNDLTDTLHFPFDDAFHYVAIRDVHDPDKWSMPYIGITLDMTALHGSLRKEKEPKKGYFVFFSPETVINFEVKGDLSKSLDLSINLLEPFLKWLEIPQETFYLKAFLDKILAAQTLLKSRPSLVPNQEEWSQMIEKKLQSEGDKTRSLFKSSEGDGEYYQQEVKYYIKEYVEHYKKIGLIWGLTTLTKSDLFGSHPLSNLAPIGMGTVDKSYWGRGLERNTVFYSDQKYQTRDTSKLVKTLPDDLLTTHLDVIAPEGIDYIFFGNTLRLEDGGGGKKRQGDLTIGTHGGPILRSLARSTHQTALFISGNRIVTVSSADGNEMANKAWYHLPIDTLLSKASGIVNVEGEDYFFLHMTPDKNIDLHFFIFNPKKEEFAFINSVDKGAKEVIRKLSLQMRFAAIGGLVFVLFFLNKIAKRITKPITHLASVTKTVAEGKLDAIEMPDPVRKESQDEIHMLYDSFFEMVKGLREKERVRGILNKVVSKEIATEALKGNIQLGGEEKYVTVFFADIREFTKMTEKMSPKEVIQFVNRCMTKVSNKIDQFEGVIDKYVGDEVMALFGAPIEKQESALNAIKSAVSIIEELKLWNLERKKEGKSDIEMGIGIHTGNVVAGNMGAENRLNYTVLGANVNLASRICSVAKGMEILISQETFHEEGVQHHFECEKLESVKLKGFKAPIAVYSVKGYRH